MNLAEAAQATTTLAVLNGWHREWALDWMWSVRAGVDNLTQFQRLAAQNPGRGSHHHARGNYQPQTQRAEWQALALRREQDGDINS